MFNTTGFLLHIFLDYLNQILYEIMRLFNYDLLIIEKKNSLFSHLRFLIDDNKIEFIRIIDNR